MPRRPARGCRARLRTVRATMTRHLHDLDWLTSIASAAERDRGGGHRDRRRPVGSQRFLVPHGVRLHDGRPRGAPRGPQPAQAHRVRALPLAVAARAGWPRCGRDTSASRPACAGGRRNARWILAWSRGPVATRPVRPGRRCPRRVGARSRPSAAAADRARLRPRGRLPPVVQAWPPSTRSTVTDWGPPVGFYKGHGGCRPSRSLAIATTDDEGSARHRLTPVGPGVRSRPADVPRRAFAPAPSDRRADGRRRGQRPSRRPIVGRALPDRLLRGRPPRRRPGARRLPLRRPRSRRRTKPSRRATTGRPSSIRPSPRSSSASAGQCCSSR